MSDLHLHLKECYFRDIVAGLKPFEYRERNAYWEKRLLNPDGTWRVYAAVVFHNAYKPGAENRLRVAWRPPHTEEITHPHFGDKPVGVFSIPTQSPKSHYEFPCTECGGDAFIAAVRWDGENKIREYERLCSSCGNRRGVSSFFHASKKGGVA